MTRPLRLAAAAGLALVVLLLTGAVVAHAAMPARVAAREAALGAVDRHATFPEVDGDVELAAAAWQSAVPGLPGLGALRAMPPDAGGARRAALMRALCGDPFDVRSPGAPLIPGDLMMLALHGSPRVAIVVTAAEVATVDRDHVATLLALRVITADDRVENLDAAAFVVVACHFDGRRLLGTDDTGVAPPGRVAMGDVGAALDHLQAEAEHPRDGGTGLLHAITHPVATTLRDILGRFLRLVDWLLSHAGPAIDAVVSWLQDHLGPLAWPLVAAWALVHALGRRLDLRLLHAVLVWVAMVALVVFLGPMALTGILVVVAIGAVTGWLSPRDILRLLAAALWNVAVFAVDTLTGVDGSGSTPLGAVLIALVSDVLIFAKPLGLLARAGPLLEALPGVFRGLGAAERVADGVNTLRSALVLRPVSALESLRGAGGLLRGGIARVLGGDGARAVAPGGIDAAVAAAADAGGGGLRRVASTAAAHIGDVASWTWRGGSAVAGDVLGFGADWVRVLRGLPRGGGLARVLTGQPAAVAAADAVVGLHRLSTIRGAALTAADAINGTASPVWSPSPPGIDPGPTERLAAALRRSLVLPP